MFKTFLRSQKYIPTSFFFFLFFSSSFWSGKDRIRPSSSCCFFLYGQNSWLTYSKIPLIMGVHPYLVQPRHRTVWPQSQVDTVHAGRDSSNLHLGLAQPMLRSIKSIFRILLAHATSLADLNLGLTPSKASGISNDPPTIELQPC